MSMNGTITLVSNKGQGSTRSVSIPAGATAAEIFHAELGVEDPDKYSVWVNGAICGSPKDTILKDGDFVVITPRQVKGGFVS